MKRKIIIAGILGVFLLVSPAKADQLESLNTLETVSAEAVDSPNTCPQGQCSWVESVNTLGRKHRIKLEKVPSDGIEQHLPIGRTADTGIPDTIQGIWWLNFGQKGDLLASFAVAEWDAQNRIATLPVYGAGAFSFHGTEIGAASYYPLLATQFRYEFKFSDQDRFATITPSLKILGLRVSIPESIVKLTMHLQADGNWVRETRLFGQRTPDYNLERIVTPVGLREPAYGEYLKVAEEYSYVAVKSE